MTENTSEFVPIDTDADGVDDAFAQQQSDGTTLIATDHTGDGAFDNVVRLDAEGNPIEFVRDIDGDGAEDVHVNEQAVTQYDAEGNIIDVDATDQTEISAAYPGAASYPSDQTIGDPFEKADFWFQQAVSGWCGPASVAQIIAEYSGAVDLQALEGQVAQAAIDNGWLSYSEGGKFDGWSGMTTPDLNTLLNELGVPADVEHGDMTQLAQYLAEGREIIVAVDADETWARVSAEDSAVDLDPDAASVFHDDDGVDAGIAPDHFVTVVGIDLDRGVVLLNDPGHPDGELAVIPIEQFDDAWRDSGHEMIVTRSAGPESFANEAPHEVADEQTPFPSTVPEPIQEQTPAPTPVQASPATPVVSSEDATTGTAVDDVTPAQPATSSPAAEPAASDLPQVVLASSRELNLDQGAVLLPVVLSGPVAAAGGALAAVMVRRATERAGEK